MSTHVYQPLEGPEHIRLIALHPASSKDAPLEITFLASTLEDLEGRYEAISYTWGEPLLTFALHVDDGTQVCVTKNLDRALRYLRYNDRNRLLWADAACINQSDNAEKAVQIPLMVDIFRGAQRVMAWLDPGGDTTLEQRGMRIIERLSRKSKIRHEIWVEGCREVSCFINLPWFSRLWIVQEIVFSVEVLLICGDTGITLPRFIAALSFIQEEASPLESDDRAKLDAIAKIGSLWIRHSLFATQPMRSPQSSLNESSIDGSDILSLVETFALYACTDPRDRLFALVSMAANVEPAGSVTDVVASSTSQEKGVVSMNMDYSLNVLETYKSFAVSCWEATPGGMWEALFLRQHSSPPDDWPSWVPDWRVVPKKTLVVNEDDFHFDCRVTSATGSGIRIETGRDRILDKQRRYQVPYPYTIRSKVSSKSVNSEVLYESQLLQLCNMVTDFPVMLGSDHMKFRSLLYKTIRKSLLRLGYDTGLGESEPDNPWNKDILHKLIEYFSLEARQSGGGDSRYGSTSTSSKRQDQASEDTVNLFVFLDEGTWANSIGYSNVSPEVGDQIVPVGYVYKDCPYGELMAAMILRATSPSIDGIPTYRFVGTGRIYDPSQVFVQNTWKWSPKETKRFDLLYCNTFEHVYHKFFLV